MTKSEGPIGLEDQVCFGVYSAGIAIQRAYKPLLDQLGITYPQYLVLNLLWRQDAQTVGRLADQLALESSTLTPLLKRLEGAGLVRRERNPADERQVHIALTEAGRALRTRASCLGERLLAASQMSIAELSELNRSVRKLRDRIYADIGGWTPDTPA
ncbi:MarR family winged helix-turn-helix transcriptional regulator [Phenylobacterium deserti]|uniref:MarR family transcriptional regulator n=1 Tax=Phenylobacterium deserti TaxID=1914756 RepID=A0A328AU02_9CAUL|nr:MarR family transcriptional regulator [Phenylobacterium deserti]RAK58049.1 MarR family transcriptional regulator [Phenylobacterium deserti]